MGNTVNKTSPVYKQYRLQMLASQIQSGSLRFFALLIKYRYIQSFLYKSAMLLLIRATFISGQQFATKDLLSSLIDKLKGGIASSHKKFQCRKCRYVVRSKI